jgi:hypothetical protein
MNAWVILGPLLVIAGGIAIYSELRPEKDNPELEARMRDMVRPWQRARGAWVDRPVVYAVGAALAALVAGGIFLVSGLSQTGGI